MLLVLSIIDAGTPAGELWARNARAGSRYVLPEIMSQGVTETEAKALINAAINEGLIESVDCRVQRPGSSATDLRKGLKLTEKGETAISPR